MTKSISDAMFEAGYKSPDQLALERAAAATAALKATTPMFNKIAAAAVVANSNTTKE